ncbi:hypothetical protein [Curtobacterium sp. MCLR17_044]|uniref:hypothetical protein n=1 Tax=Curtobacterium sp. MCLR17_044 TaxID=2175628 RepID=UPI0011B5609F|nr:hypothetical protein [Curtobacterium sp. MCLR17_044]
MTQPVLDFLDVDLATDTKVFVDPYAFRFVETDWAREATALLQDFYSQVARAVRTGDHGHAMYLLSSLSEPNEAHLGLSRGRSRGSGVSDGLARTLIDAFTSSPAIADGLADELEESVLFIENIGHDRLSDMTINIVRRPLIEFTQEMCQRYEIELIPGVDSGQMWDRHSHEWRADHVDLPMPSGKLLLIPKAVVRKTNTFDPGEYLQHFVLPYLQRRELDTPNSPLVRQRASKRGKPGDLYVTKKSIRQDREKRRGDDSAKPWNTEVTAQSPEVLASYRKAAQKKTEPPSHEDLARATNTPLPDWPGLLRSVEEVPPGREGADDYHWAIQNLLNALFFPALTSPRRESEIHEGRKRIDIRYVNQAQSGFFHWVREIKHVPSSFVVVECKNYTGPLSNPEFDQLTGRFSEERGKVGLLCYRGFADDKDNVIRRCRDTALDGRGYVLPLDDADLRRLVETRDETGETQFEFLIDRFAQII